MGNVNTLTRRKEKTKTVAHKGAPIESGRGFFMIQIGRVNIVSKNAHRRFTPKVAELTGISGRIESEWVAELTGIRIQAVELLLQAVLGALAGVDRAPDWGGLRGEG